MRMSNIINKQLWFIVFIAVIGGGLIYFLNSIGVIEAMRNDNTLDYLYDSNLKLPKAPYKQKVQFTTGYFSEEDLKNAESVVQRQSEISRIDSIITRYYSEHESKSRKAIHAVPSEQTIKQVIPHIIHQTWDSYKVPKTFVNNIRSWVNHHPQWEYWFWTEKAIQCFLKKEFPQHVILYDTYPDATSKADAMRYFVLYRYGGVYIDLDTKCLKPLDVWTNHFCCILTEEPYEHSFIVNEGNKSNIVNSPMACQSGHKLFQKAIASLPEYAGNYLGDYMHSTGPLFLADMYQKYKESISEQTTDCEITITPPKYFLPRYDPSQSEIIDSRCSVRSYKTLPKSQRDVCLNLIDRRYKNLVNDQAFMDHNWLHVALLGPDWKQSNTVNFFDILPNAKNLEDYFCS